MSVDTATVAATPAPSNDAPAQATPAPAATPGTATPSTTDTPFLKVNDRTSYKSAEDAIKGFNDAQTRIAELSPWSEFINAGYTPEQVIQIVNDFQKQQEAAQAAAAQPAATGAQPATLSPEWKAHIDFLKSQGIFTTMEELQKLKSQVETLSQSQQGEYQARVDGARTNGESILDGFIKDSGLQLDDEGKQFVHDSVEDGIIRASRDAQGNLIPNSPEDRFIRGDAAERASIINTYFKRFTQFGDTYAKRQTAQLVDQKAAAQAASPRPLPASTSPVPAPPSAGRGFKDPGLNARVQAAMEAELARRGGGPLL